MALDKAMSPSRLLKVLPAVQLPQAWGLGPLRHIAPAIERADVSSPGDRENGISSWELLYDPPKDP